uniref:hypothetical protein n=1 Tax=Flavobacterium sp. TaxID=239 RepID=UPI00404A21C0
MENNNLQLNEQAVLALKESAKWTYFLSILGFIGIGFMVLLALFMTSIFSSLPDSFGNEYKNEFGFDPFGAVQTIFSVMYLLIAVFYFFPVFYLYKYAVGIKESMDTRSSDLLSNAFVNLKSHHKFLGITALVIISLYAFIFLIAIFALTLSS